MQAQPRVVEPEPHEGQQEVHLNRMVEHMKGTVSTNRGFQFKVYKIQSMLLLSPLMIFHFLILIYVTICFKTVSMKTLTNYADVFLKLQLNSPVMRECPKAATFPY